VPKDKDPVLLKGQHTDAWTGTSVNTLFAKTFFTSVDQYNGMTVSPGSHLQGLVPVRNRNIDPIFNVKFDSINLSHVEMGDFLIWHPLLIHSTTGHSDKNIRISLTSRFTSTETTFSSQERALGYRTLNVGPMNQVLRLIGNDYLTPFRTYGGFVGIDRRLSDIYEHSEYQKIFDYTPYLI
jgi:ectoine hydroxylase-related dioxygenase (phytanoyl-CoA dioxygenase family)